MRIVKYITLLFAVGAYATALEALLRFQQYMNGSANAMPWSAALLDKTKQPPLGDWKLPPLASKTPAYVLVSLSGTDFLAILDSRSRGDSFYTRLYFDANGNRDLTDDPEVAVSCSYSWWEGRGEIVTNSALNVSLPMDGHSVPYAFLIRAYCNFTSYSTSMSRDENWSNLNVLITPACMLTGEFDYAGDHYRFCLCDQDGNGRFDDVASSQVLDNHDIDTHTGDTIYLTTKGRIEYEDALGMADRLFLKDTLFEVRIDRASSRMVMTPVSQGLGTLTLPAGVKRLVLARADGAGAVAYLNPEQKVVAPVGDYRLHSYEIIRADKSGRFWRLTAEGAANGKVTKVVDGTQNSLIACEPLRPGMKLAYVRKPGFFGWSGGAGFDFLLRGAGGEEVTSLLCGGSRPLSEITTRDWSNPAKPPSYKIMIGDGQIVAQGQFEYG